MSRLDLVIFGATGFTGKHAVAELARVASKYPGLSWGVAGRSKNKLEEVLAEVSKKIGHDLSSIKVIIADVGDEKSLKDMCSQANVVVDCCGPYRLYGEPVVKAAIDSKTNYVDVSGEPQFIETMQLVYDKAARDAGVYVVSACGFDSIPNDLGVIFLQQNFGGTLNSVESYISLYIPPEHRAAAWKYGAIHYGTWESLVHSMAEHKELASLRKKLYPEPLPSFKPKLQPRSTIHKRNGKWCVPFLGSDASIVYRTQRHLYEKFGSRPAQFKAYVKFPSLIYVLVMTLVGLVLYAMSGWNCTKKLLLKHPRLFSLGMITRQGPRDEVMNNSFFTFELTGKGWSGEVEGEPNKEMSVKVKGVNPGYGATVTALIFSAITILKEQNKLPSQGGVYTSGVAFKDTDLIKHLNENNLTFEVVEAK